MLSGIILDYILEGGDGAADGGQVAEELGELGEGEHVGAVAFGC